MTVVLNIFLKVGKHDYSHCELREYELMLYVL